MDREGGARGLLLGGAGGLAVGFHTEGTGEVRVSEVGRGINAFTLDFLRALPEGILQENLTVSPQSIYQALAMSYIASGGDTREELAGVFRYPENNDTLVQELAGLREQLKDDADHAKTELELANSAWIDRSYATFRDRYVRQLKEAFEAETEEVHFKNSESACGLINQWISEKTRGKIRGSLGPGDLASRSGPGIIDEPGLVLVNAVYFKSDWASRFNASETQDGPFYLPGGATRQTAFMHQRSLLLYGEDEAFQFLELPYVDREFAMLVLLPREVVGVGEMLADVSGERIFELLRKSSIHDTDVLLPKFEIESHVAVGDILKGMGVKDAFSNQKADFDAMIHKNLQAYRVYLSSVHHDAMIEVHEEGTKAAAATTSTHYTFGCSAAVSRTPPAVFHADHPFLFLIVHAPSRSILFAGWMAEPE